jgi:hypothetical protein
MNNVRIAAGIVAVTIVALLGVIAIRLHHAPRAEPETWCSKRLVGGFHLVGEKLHMVAYAPDEAIAYGTLTCNYERERKPTHDPKPAVAK